jgi:hypothetical protein
MKNIVFVFSVMLCAPAFLQDLNLGLVGYFPFNGNANDESTTNIDGTVNNAILDVGLGNQLNGSYYFNGTNSYIDCGVSNRSITDVVTVSYWIKTNSLAPQYPVSKYSWAEDAGYFSVLENGLVGTAGRDGSNSFNFTGYGTTNIADNQWHHVISVVNVNEWQVWVDCSLEADLTTSTGSPSVSGAEPLIIGKWGFENSYHTSGNIDEVRIYNRALTPTEITMLCDESQFLSTDLNFNDVNDINIYPNPATDVVTISLRGGEKIEIVNTLGEIILRTEVVTTTVLTLNISTWAKGMYIVNLTSSEGTRSKKLIVQ